MLAYALFNVYDFLGKQMHVYGKCYGVGYLL